MPKNGGWDRKQRKITTHSASYVYPYDHHTDISDDKCEGIRKRGITRVELTSGICMNFIILGNRLFF